MGALNLTLVLTSKLKAQPFSEEQPLLSPHRAKRRCPNKKNQTTVHRLKGFFIAAGGGGLKASDGVPRTATAAGGGGLRASDGLNVLTWNFGTFAYVPFPKRPERPFRYRSGEP
ncbi:THO complex subunit 2 [Dorcoceras hygrometricum]|uniref:THO complex subunit 2 n=1 Tax=Dorcoceras hygrometricum TaxID=472368 RepID=A0A2Z7CBD8_9LAMI|nr:THO complex subunit 2 [Dorcoceras hygrometricum]